MEKSNHYEGLSADYKARLSKLNKKTWESCRKILTDEKSYDTKVLKEEIDVFIGLLEQSYNKSDFRKFDNLMELIELNLLLIPIRFLHVSSIRELEDLTRDAVGYYRINDQLINKEPPL